MYSAEDIKKIEEMKRAETEKRNILSQCLTKDAFERLARVRIADPRSAAEAEMHIMQLKKSGRLIRPITDERLRDVLSVVAGERKEFKIKRK